MEFPKPAFDYRYRPEGQIAALREYARTKQGRQIPDKVPGRLLVAIWKMLDARGLHLAPHSTFVGGSNIRDNRAYDQIAFFPGVGDRLESSGVFDFDGAIFKTLWSGRSPNDFYAYVQYYISDHRPLWACFRTD